MNHDLQAMIEPETTEIGFSVTFKGVVARDGAQGDYRRLHLTDRRA